MLFTSVFTKPQCIYALLLLRAVATGFCSARGCFELVLLLLLLAVERPRPPLRPRPLRPDRWGIFSRLSAVTSNGESESGFPTGDSWNNMYNCQSATDFLHIWENNIKMGLKEAGSKGVGWIHLAEDRDQSWALTNTVTKPRVWKSAENLTSLANISFPHGILFHVF
jgi:hypothetical protein